MTTSTRFGAALLGTALAGLLGSAACGEPAAAPARDPAQVATASPPTSGPEVSTTSLDGAALYAQHCAGCHADTKKGSTAARIHKAIDGNIGHMGMLKSLTEAEVAAIAAAP